VLVFGSRTFTKKVAIFLNSVLRKFDLRLVQANRPLRSLEEFLRHVSDLGFQPALIVDIGVADGTPEIYAAYPSTKYVLIEPLVEFEQTIRALCRDLDAEYILAAADETTGEIMINVHEDLNGSSILSEVEGSLADGVERAVHAVRLDDVLAQISNDKEMTKLLIL